MVDTIAIEELIEPSLAASGYRLVRVLWTGGRGPTLQVMAERVDEMPMSLDDCVGISHTLSAVLDIADPFPGAYRLEVSSPGVDRPLTRPADYHRFGGREARIELNAPVNGRRRFRGRLAGIAGDTVRLATATGEELLPLAGVARANLVAVDAPPRPATGRVQRALPSVRRRPIGVRKH